MKIFTFGIDAHYPGAKHHQIPAKWVSQAEATALVDKAMQQKTFLGTPVYTSREDAEKGVIHDLYMKETGINVSGDEPYTREDKNLGAFFGGVVSAMGLGFCITRMRKGL